MSCDRKFPVTLAGAEPKPSGETDDENLRTLPSAEALLAGTLALMTGVVERAALTQPLAGHAQSLMMAAKVRSNLFFLSGHPHVSSGFRMTLERLRSHWDRLVTPGTEPEPATAPNREDLARQLWHRAPERVQ